jgi:hypothetical protein
VIRTAQLLDLPRTVRLERVRREHERHIVQKLRERAGEVRVPGVAVYDVDVRQSAAHHQVLQQRVEQLHVPRIARAELDRRLHAVDP